VQNLKSKTGLTAETRPTERRAGAEGTEKIHDEAHSEQSGTSVHHRGDSDLIRNDAAANPETGIARSSVKQGREFNQQFVE